MKNKNNFEEKADYVIALMDEISNELNSLLHYSSSQVGHHLDIINDKIDRARGMGLNVDDIDNQILKFRFILFKRDIDDKIGAVEKNMNYNNFNISKLETEYKELQQEANIDQVELDACMKKLHDEVIRIELKYMIDHIEHSDGISVYNLGDVMEKISQAKKKGVYVSDIVNTILDRD